MRSIIIAFWVISAALFAGTVNDLSAPKTMVLPGENVFLHLDYNRTDPSTGYKLGYTTKKWVGGQWVTRRYFATSLSDLTWDESDPGLYRLEGTLYEAGDAPSSDYLDVRVLGHTCLPEYLCTEGDDTYCAVDMNFTYPHVDGNNYGTAYISTNGFITFDQGNTCQPGYGGFVDNETCAKYLDADTNCTDGYIPQDGLCVRAPGCVRGHFVSGPSPAGDDQCQWRAQELNIADMSPEQRSELTDVVDATATPGSRSVAPNASLLPHAEGPETPQHTETVAAISALQTDTVAATPQDPPVASTPNTAYSVVSPALGCSSGYLSGNHCYINESNANALRTISENGTFCYDYNSAFFPSCYSRSEMRAKYSNFYSMISYGTASSDGNGGTRYDGITYKRAYCYPFSYTLSYHSSYDLYLCTRTVDLGPATPTCDSGYVLQGWSDPYPGKCVKATTTYSCPSGMHLSADNSQCLSDTFVCPDGYMGPDANNECHYDYTSSTPPTTEQDVVAVAYSCPSGQRLNGTKCERPVSYEAHYAVKTGNVTCYRYGGVSMHPNCTSASEMSEYYDGFVNVKFWRYGNIYHWDGSTQVYTSYKYQYAYCDPGFSLGHSLSGGAYSCDGYEVAGDAQMTCPSGYSLNGGATPPNCTRVYDSCPSGTQLSADGSQCLGNDPVCPSGYTGPDANNACIKIVPATCRAGLNLFGQMCYKVDTVYDCPKAPEDIHDTDGCAAPQETPALVTVHTVSMPAAGTPLGCPTGWSGPDEENKCSMQYSTKSCPSGRTLSGDVCQEYSDPSCDIQYGLSGTPPMCHIDWNDYSCDAGSSLFQRKCYGYGCGSDLATRITTKCYADANCSGGTLNSSAGQCESAIGYSCDNIPGELDGDLCRSVGESLFGNPVTQVAHGIFDGAYSDYVGQVRVKKCTDGVEVHWTGHQYGDDHALVDKKVTIRPDGSLIPALESR